MDKFRELEEKLKDIMQECDLYNNKVKELDKIISEIDIEIKDLESEKSKYNTDLQTVQSERNSALERLVSTSSLDNEFNVQQFSDIVSRIRARESAKNNG